MVYKWKSSYAPSIPAEKVGKVFEKIEKKNGELTPALVLEEARPEKSILHSVFEWRDDVAAEKYRLEQASYLIRAMVIEVEDETEEPYEVRAYVNVSESTSGSFININNAFKNTETREIVLKRALDELRAFEKKYASLTQFSKLFEEIHKLLAA